MRPAKAEPGTYYRITDRIWFNVVINLMNLLTNTVPCLRQIRNIPRCYLVDCLACVLLLFAARFKNRRSSLLCSFTRISLLLTMLTHDEIETGLNTGYLTTMATVNSNSSLSSLTANFNSSMSLASTNIANYKSSPYTYGYLVYTGRENKLVQLYIYAFGSTTSNHLCDTYFQDHKAGSLFTIPSAVCHSTL